MVILGPNESIESALRRFKKKLENEGIAKDFKEKQYYVKPSQQKHEHDRSVKHRLDRKKALSERKGQSRRRKRKRNRTQQEVR
jgi:small subunit ribosomal protein S21